MTQATMLQTKSPVNRPALGVRPDPFKYRTDEPGLPKAFLDLLRDLREELPCRLVKPTAPEKEQVESFWASFALLRERVGQWNQFLRSVVEANIDVRGAPSAEACRAMAREKAAELCASLPVVTIARPTLFDDWEFMAQPANEIHAAFDDFLTTRSQQAVQAFIASLDALHGQRLVGLLQHSAKNNKVCRFVYFRSVVIHETVDERDQHSSETKVTRTEDRGRWEERTVTRRKHVHESDKRRTHRNARHEQTLFNAKPYAWDDASVQKPHFVQWLLRVAPELVRKHIQVVAGDVSRDLVVEADVRVENWTEKSEEETVVEKVERGGDLWDPAVCLGPYVLSGWSDRDLA